MTSIFIINCTKRISLIHRVWWGSSLCQNPGHDSSVCRISRCGDLSQDLCAYTCVGQMNEPPFPFKISVFVSCDADVSGICDRKTLTDTLPKSLCAHLGASSAYPTYSTDTTTDIRQPPDVATAINRFRLFVTYSTWEPIKRFCIQWHQLCIRGTRD